MSWFVGVGSNNWGDSWRWMAILETGDQDTAWRLREALSSRFGEIGPYRCFGAREESDPAVAFAARERITLYTKVVDLMGRQPQLDYESAASHTRRGVERGGGTIISQDKEVGQLAEYYHFCVRVLNGLAVQDDPTPAPEPHDEAQGSPAAPVPQTIDGEDSPTPHGAIRDRHREVRDGSQRHHRQLPPEEALKRAQIILAYEHNCRLPGDQRRTRREFCKVFGIDEKKTIKGKASLKTIETWAKSKSGERIVSDYGASPEGRLWMAQLPEKLSRIASKRG